MPLPKTMRFWQRRPVDSDQPVSNPSLPTNRLTASISVVMITYNHEKYIGEAIESVLAQSFTDFDFVIVNDSSTDDTDAIIRRYTDPRIMYFTQENQGVSAALNHGFAQAKGQYVAIMSGDDVCYPHRLARQRDFLLNQRAQIVTSWIEVIGDDSTPFDRPDLIATCNCIPAASQAEMLQKLFWTGNYLWPSSAMVDSSLFWKAGGFCLSSLQLQDFMLWIELVKRTRIYTLTEPLLKYRVRAGGANLSQEPRNYTRAEFELQQVYRSIFDNLPEHIFRDAFAHQLRRPAFSGEQEYAVEQAFLYLQHSAASVRALGVMQLFDLMQDETVVRVLKDQYQFSLPDFYKLENDPEHHAPS